MWSSSWLSRQAWSGSGVSLAPIGPPITGARTMGYDRCTRPPTLLRAWRARVQPAEVGSPFGGRSTRTPGLRREELAWLAGVSPDYIKRIELACRLVGHATPREGLVPQHIGPSVRRRLDRRSPASAFSSTSASGVTPLASRPVPSVMSPLKILGSASAARNRHGDSVSSTMPR